MKLLRKLFPRRLYRFFNKWNKKAETKLNLVNVFTHGGYNYYRFPKETNMPLERFSMSMSLLERLSSGLSGTELEMILTEMEKDISLGLSNPRNAARVTTYIHVLRERQSTIIHRDILLNIAATWLIRDDENPSIINPDIHQKKLEAFEEMCKEGAHDFFTRAGIDPLLPLLTMSPEDFKILWEHNIQLQRQLLETISQLTIHRDIGRKKGKTN